MTKSKRTPLRLVRQDNAVAALPPAAIVCAADIKQMVQRKVQKGGAVNISMFRRGARVFVAQINAQTAIVSGLPVGEIKQILDQIPRSKTSAFGKLSDQLRGQPHKVIEQRIRGPYTGIAKVPSISDEVALKSADVQPGRRAR